MGRKHCKGMASPYKQGKHSRCLILRHESKFFQVKLLVFIHSACSCTNCGLKCFPESCELHHLNFLFFFCNFFSQATDIPSRKKNCLESTSRSSVARLKARLVIPSFAVLHTEKLFSVQHCKAGNDAWG